MRKTLSLLVAIIAVYVSTFFLTGCATVGVLACKLPGIATAPGESPPASRGGANGQNRPIPWVYSGVTCDIDFIQSSARDNPSDWLGWDLLIACDVPLSAAADTAILPFTIPAQAISGDMYK